MGHHHIHEGFLLTSVAIAFCSGLTIGAIKWHPNKDLREGLIDVFTLRIIRDRSIHRQMKKELRVLQKLRHRRDRRKAAEEAAIAAVDGNENYFGVFGITVGGQPVNVVYDRTIG